MTGYREHASGLLVPAELSRVREVWTKDEWRLINRAFKLLESRKVAIFLGCSETAACKAAPIESIRQGGSTYLLRCAHKDRVLQRDF